MEHISKHRVLNQLDIDTLLLISSPSGRTKWYNLEVRLAIDPPSQVCKMMGLIIDKELGRKLRVHVDAFAIYAYQSYA